MFARLIKALFYTLGPISTMIVGSNGHEVFAFLMAFAFGNVFQCDVRKMIEENRT